GKHAAQSQADQEPQLLNRAVRFILQGTRFFRIAILQNKAFGQKTVAETKFAVLAQAERARPAKDALGNRTHHLLDLVVATLLEEIVKTLMGIGLEPLAGQGVLYLAQGGFRIGNLGVQAGAAL